jgi:hypothetical protein
MENEIENQKMNDSSLATLLCQSILIGTLLLCAPSSLVLGQTQISSPEELQWEWIVPLRSVKADVEKVYGNPLLENGYVSAYQTSFGNVTVFYYGSVNIQKNGFACNVPNDSVFAFSVSLAQAIPLGDLNVDLQDFQRTESPRGLVQYINARSGVSFVTSGPADNGNGVLSMRYDPSKSNIERQCTVAQDGWRGIVPLVTTREDVEMKFGKPTEAGFYEFDEGRVFVKYVVTSCETVVSCDCLVPIGTVMSVRVKLYYDLSLQSLQLKSKGFSEQRDTHHPGIVSYFNEESGRSYEVQDGKVTHITYYESKAFCDAIMKKSNRNVRNN